MANGSSLFLGNGYKYSREAKCDRCNRTVNELIVLKKNKFTKSSSKKERKYRRVCLYCASELSIRGRYYFGSFWRDFMEEVYIYKHPKIRGRQ